MSNLRYEITHNALDRGYENGKGHQIQNNATAQSYRRSIDHFCSWLKESYNINNSRQLEKAGGSKKFLQEYEQKLEKDGKSSNTIHLYISPVAKGLGIHAEEIQKPQRRAIDISRSRGDEKVNSQGKKELLDPRYSRLVEFAKATGLRRAEIAQLKVACVKRDESGCLCVEVVHGKGGKPQLQRILPDDTESFVKIINNARDAVRGTGRLMSMTPLFSRAEMANKIDLHAIRADHARRAYDYYLDRCKTPEGKTKLRDELVARWNACHGGEDRIMTTKSGEYEGVSIKAKNYVKAFSATGHYTVRGDNRVKCLRQGRPIAYERTALLAVSVFELSHWRNDVTVKDYML